MRASLDSLTRLQETQTETDNKSLDVENRRRELLYIFFIWGGNHGFESFTSTLNLLMQRRGYSPARWRCAAARGYPAGTVPTATRTQTTQYSYTDRL